MYRCYYIITKFINFYKIFLKLISLLDFFSMPRNQASIKHAVLLENNKNHSPKYFFPKAESAVSASYSRPF